MLLNSHCGGRLKRFIKTCCWAAETGGNQWERSRKSEQQEAVLEPDVSPLLYVWTSLFKTSVNLPPRFMAWPGQYATVVFTQWLLVQHICTVHGRDTKHITEKYFFFCVSWTVGGTYSNAPGFYCASGKFEVTLLKVVEQYLELRRVNLPPTLQ